jgi:outer membrane protein insertion porin family
MLHGGKHLFGGLLGLLTATLGCAKADVNEAKGPVAVAISAVPTSGNGLIPLAAERADAAAGATLLPRRAAARFSFFGNLFLSSDELQQVVHADETSLADAITTQAELDVAAVASLYADHGYPFARVELVLSEQDRPFIDVGIRIDEGELYAFRKVSIVDGTTKRPLATPEARALAALTKHAFSRAALAQALADVTRTFADRGYADASVTPHAVFDHAARAVDVEARVETGPLVYVDRVSVVGHRATTEAQIRRAIVVREGSLSRSSELERSVTQVRALGYFADVFVSSQRVDPSHRAYTFELVEGPAESSSSLLEAAHAHRAVGEELEARALLSRISRRYVYSRDAARAALEIADIDFGLGAFFLAESEYSSWVANHPSAPEIMHARARAAEADAILRGPP